MSQNRLEIAMPKSTRNAQPKPLTLTLDLYPESTVLGDSEALTPTPLPILGEGQGKPAARRTEPHPSPPEVGAGGLRDGRHGDGGPGNGPRIADVLSALDLEFDRLNALHFDGKCERPTVEFSLRKSYGGYYQKRCNRIVLSWQAFREYGWEETINTFRHEVAHIVHQNHSPAFWQLAHQLGVIRKYAREPIKQRAQRILIYECPVCRKRIHRKRKIANSSCASCDRKYNPNFRLRLVEMTLTVPTK